MVTDARHRLATVKQLPYDAEIEYLESTGTQWIDTGVVPNQNTSIKICFQINSSGTGTTSCIFGIRQSYLKNGFTVLFDDSDNKLTIDYGDNRISTASYPSGKYTLLKNKRNNYVNDVLASSNTVQTFVCTGNLFLFAMRNISPDTVYFPTAFKLFYCQIYDDSVLIRDFIPVRFTNELGQSEGAMYDKVSGRLFRNQGSGSFVMGDDVIPYDAEVEYLESTGTQWIDTGVYLRTPLKIEWEYYYPNRSDKASIWGAYRQSSINCHTGNGNASTGREVSVTYNGTAIKIFNSSITPFFPYHSTATFEAQEGSQAFTTEFGEASASVVSGLGDTLTAKCYLFAQGRPNDANPPNSIAMAGARIYSWKCWVGGELVFDGIPVRIGTIGYMYDRANPKGGLLGNGLYPNSGSGDFTLGKDVAYPKRKFEITYRKPQIYIAPPTARDYISDGLIAMWDGIENAGGGTHDPNATTWKDLTENGYDLGIRALSSIAFWGDDCFTFNKTSLGGSEYFWYRTNTDLQTRLGSVLTLEMCVFTRDGSTRNYSSYFGNAGNYINGLGAALSVSRKRFEIFATTAGAASGESGLITAALSDVVGRRLTISYIADSEGTKLVFNNVPMGTGGAINTLHQTEICVGSSYDANGDGSNPYSSSYYRTPLATFHCVRIYSRALTAEEIAHNYAIDKIRFNLP